jgi:hypothetical protein
MKNYQKLLVITTVLFLFGIALTGCSNRDALGLFEQTVVQNIEITNTLDDVEAQDMADSSIDSITLLSLVSFSLIDSENPTVAEKIAAIRSAREDIRTLHQAIVIDRQGFRISVADLRETIVLFRESGLSLNDEQLAQLQVLRAELIAIGDTLRGTIGQAFAKMRDLRGHYTLSNIDLILSTHQEVLAVLQTRQVNLERANAILDEVIGMITVPAV